MNEDYDYDCRNFDITWQNIYSGSCAIASNIKNNYDADVILCAQEDVMPASIVANELDLPLCVVHFSEKKNGIIVESVPRLSRAIRSGVYNQGKLPKVIIVSALIDDERNVDDIVKCYKENEPVVMSLYGRKNSKITPDYRWVLLARLVNCVFPWEKNNTNNT